MTSAIGKALEAAAIDRWPNFTSTSPSRISSTRPTCCARSTISSSGAGRLRQPGGLALSGDGHQGTIAEAERLWKEVDRKNLMVKVPATPRRPARDPAADRRRHQHQHHAAVLAEGLCRRSPRPISPGLEKYVAGGGDPSHVASVASFFVSRIDSAVDKQLDEKIAQANDPTEKERLAALKGKVAIANAKLAYQHYKRLFSGARWDKLAAKGAKPQRLLWASTGTKNKDYSDVLYVEELIGRDTVNTVPPATLDAFRDHGKLRDSLEENVDGSRGTSSPNSRNPAFRSMRSPAELVKDGVQAVRRRRRQAARRGRPQARRGARRRHRRTSSWRSAPTSARPSSKAHRGLARRRQNPPALAARQIGLDRQRRRQMAGLARQRRRGADIADYEDFAQRVKGQNFTDAVVLGMGGSSLGPEVLAETFAEAAGLSETACAGFHRSRRRSARCRPRSISPTRCSSSPANPAAPPNRTR